MPAVVFRSQQNFALTALCLSVYAEHNLRYIELRYFKQINKNWVDSDYPV